jgi:hypothetical protein
MKGPNKWGYDIFSFQLKSDLGKSLSVIGGGCMIAERGGKTTQQMLQQMNIGK